MAETILKVSGIVMACLTVALIGLAVAWRKKYPSSGVGAKIGKVVVSLLLVAACAASFVGVAFSNLINQYFMTLDLNDPSIQSVRAASTETDRKSVG